MSTAEGEGGNPPKVDRPNSTGELDVVGTDQGVDSGPNAFVAAGEALVGKILHLGIDGAGPWKGAQATADEVLKHCRDTEQAIKRLIAMHRRLVGVTGFATGFGGLATMAVTVPADVVSFQALSVRMIAGIAHLIGHDLESEYVRSLVLVSLLGASGTTVLGEIGVEAGTKAATAALKRVPGHVLVRLNQRVGFRLVTKFGSRGVVNLVKVIPVLGGGIGAGVNVTSVNLLAGYAKRNFPAVDDGLLPPLGHDRDG
jgi:EcsC protein family